MKEHSDKKFYGTYRGVVVRNDDPKEAGRIKVKVHPMFRNIETEVIPWAVFCDPFMGGTANHGGTFIPEVDSHVFVFFEEGDWRQPVYIGGAPAMSDGTPDLPEESRSEASEYPHNRVFRSSKGHLIEFDDTDGNLRVKLKHSGGTSMEMDNDGNMAINVEGQKNVDVVGDSNINVNGACNIHSSGDLSLTSDADVVINGANVRIN